MLGERRSSRCGTSACRDPGCPKNLQRKSGLAIRWQFRTIYCFRPRPFLNNLLVLVRLDLQKIMVQMTELDTSQIPDVYRRFADAMDENHWIKRGQQLLESSKRNTLLREYLWRENNVVFQLGRLRELCRSATYVPARSISSLYPAACLAHQLLSMMKTQDHATALKLRQRFYGAIKKPDSMRGLQLELAAATHFTSIGKRISWPETTGLGTFDLLVEGDSHPPLEVECKSIGQDKGRKLHAQEVIDFLGLVRPRLRELLQSFTGGLAVVLTIPDRFPNKYKERVALAKLLAQAILSGKDCQLEAGATVRLSDFDPGVFPLEQTEELRKTIDKLTKTANRSVLIMRTQAGGALALVLQSQRDDSVLVSTFNTLSDAARSQLTATRAGLLLVRFEGMAPQAMQALAIRDSGAGASGLQIETSRFLSSPNRSHVIGTGFLSHDAMQEVEGGVVKTFGTAYYFSNTYSSHWSDGFDNLFGWAPDPGGKAVA